MSYVTDIACARCGKLYSPGQILNLCSCGAPLLVRYDLVRIATAVTKLALKERQPNLWRYHEFLPVGKDENIVSLGEGCTPLIAAEQTARELGVAKLWIKDEARNPTGSFKDRGLSAAISMAKELGIKKVAIPSAGNAGGSLAAYAARAGIEAYVFMPRDTPKANQVEAQKYGAKVTLVEGLIHDCGRIVAQRKTEEGWFDVSTLKEPYRLEGKKTMGLEIAEQLGWRLPDVIIYPTGGGVGIIGIYKAMLELRELGWVDGDLPRLVAVQAAGCAPIVAAFARGARQSEPWPDARTVAFGLTVPKALGDFLVL